jgi:voltage-gated potassium channel
MALDPQRMRRRAYEILEVAGARDTTSRVIDWLLMALVGVNVLAVVLESVEQVANAYVELLQWIEIVSVSVFSVEYVLRLWCAAERADEGRVGRSVAGKRLGYATSPIALADLAAILPFYLSAFFAMDLRFLRALRVLRVLKLTRYSSAMRTIHEVVRQERHSLGTAFFLLCTALVLVSAGIYLAEQGAQPEAFGSIPSAMWWSIVTLTTVGYGDMTPVTSLGKLFAGLVSVVGVCLVALPTSIMASGFADVHRRNRMKLETEAEVALADGYISQEESRSFLLLADRLGVSDAVAQEIVTSAQRRLGARLDEDCPHCGKSWNET